MTITELHITGTDGVANLFTVTLSASDAKLVRPGTSAEGEALIGEARKKAANAFTALRDVLDKIVGTTAQ